MYWWYVALDWKAYWQWLQNGSCQTKEVLLWKKEEIQTHGVFYGRPFPMALVYGKQQHWQCAFVGYIITALISVWPLKLLSSWTTSTLKVMEESRQMVLLIPCQNRLFISGDKAVGKLVSAESCLVVDITLMGFPNQTERHRVEWQALSLPRDELLMQVVNRALNRPMPKGWTKKK